MIVQFVENAYFLKTAIKQLNNTQCQKNFQIILYNQINQLYLLVLLLMIQQTQATKQQFQFTNENITKQFVGDQNAFYLENCNFNIKLIGNENKMICTSDGSNFSKNYLTIEGNGNYFAIDKPTFVTIKGNANDIQGDFANITVTQLNGFGNTFPTNPKKPQIFLQSQFMKSKQKQLEKKQYYRPFQSKKTKQKQKSLHDQQFPQLFQTKPQTKQILDFFSQEGESNPFPKMEFEKKEEDIKQLQQKRKDAQSQQQEYKEIMKQKFQAANPRKNQYRQGKNITFVNNHPNPFSNQMQNGFNFRQNPYQHNPMQNSFNYPPPPMQYPHPLPPMQYPHPPPLYPQPKIQKPTFEKAKKQTDQLKKFYNEKMPMPNYNSSSKRFIIPKQQIRNLSPQEMMPRRKMKIQPIIRRDQTKKEKETETQPGPLNEEDFQYIFVSKHQGKTVNCDICYEDITIESEQTFLYCFHNYHSHCIKSWLKKDSRCPTCQLDIRKAIKQLKDGQ